MSSTDCAICMAQMVFPVQLKCRHIFCYLCVKGVTNNGNNKCPLCRKVIAKNTLKRPKFMRPVLNADRPYGAFNSMQWFYEGRDGYWAYDHSNGQLLETAFTSDQKMCEITIAGVVYCVDFVQQIQYQKDGPSRKRSIRRDVLSNMPSVKGIAGVSKHLFGDLFTPVHSQATDGEDGEQKSKKIKVEVKEEPDSTTD